MPRFSKFPRQDRVIQIRLPVRVVVFSPVIWWIGSMVKRSGSVVRALQINS
jgi:hypothetical protein